MFLLRKYCLDISEPEVWNLYILMPKLLVSVKCCFVGDGPDVAVDPSLQPPRRVLLEEGWLLYPFLCQSTNTKTFVQDAKDWS